ncbi:MAG: hypothetical protein WBF93_16455 [Pirellulales bacterium]|nr:hypothetical protein [Pirellulales bacterium]
MVSEEKQQEIEDLKDRVRTLEQEVKANYVPPTFRPGGYYTTYFATAGFVLGMFGAVTSLLFNVVGSLMVGQHPMELIRVYLTFPLGDQALKLDSGLALAVGCCLYIGTGMLLGIPFYLVLTRWTANSSFAARLAVVSVLSLAVWLINFYGILSWLQPALIEMSEKNLIVNLVPPWVAALTHLVFGWTLALVYPLGQFVPHQRITEQST